MKKIFLPIFAAVVLSSCGENATEVTVSDDIKVSEKELIDGFTKVKTQFEEIFNNPTQHKQEDLVPLTDSMAYFVDALVDGYPKSSQLAEVLCNAGVSSLNSRDGKRSEKYLTYLVDSFPEHSLVPKSLYFIGRTKEVLFKDIEGAKAAYKVLYRTFPHTNWSEIARSSIKQLSNPMLLDSMDDSSDIDTTESK
jgi:hypothetical protein